jgi:hypothetical protein
MHRARVFAPKVGSVRQPALERKPIPVATSQQNSVPRGPRDRFLQGLDILRLMIIDLTEGALVRSNCARRAATAWKVYAMTAQEATTAPKSRRQIVHARIFALLGSSVRRELHPMQRINVRMVE